MKYLKFLFSGAFMGILLIIFAVAIGYATFIENDYDPSTARALVYNARWFEILLLLMVVNFLGMIWTKHLYLKSKWNILIIHIALIIIIIGAGITRYYGYEGQMRIREGQTTDLFLSLDTYFNVSAVNGDEKEEFSRRVTLSEIPGNLFSKNISLNGEKVQVGVRSYLPSATKKLQPAESGFAAMSILVGDQDGRHDIILKSGETKYVHDLGLSFEDPGQSATVQIIRSDQGLLVKIPGYEIPDSVNIEGWMPLDQTQFYSYAGASFMVQDFYENAEIIYEAAPKGTQTGLKVAEIFVNDRTYWLEFGQRKAVMAGAMQVSFNIGQMRWRLPFELRLDDFQIERYPGSNSPSSFSSDITVIDRNKDVEMPYRIFMNNVLDYGGYRFYQSSYDRDELGTVLSVNHDYWGTLITYIGYAILFVSLIASFFTPKTRFIQVKRMIQDVHAKRKKLALKLVALVVLSSAALGVSAQNVPSIIDADHAAKFGEILIQNNNGRIEPVNTIANDLIVKLHKTSTYDDLDANQVLLSMVYNPEGWHDEKVVIVRDEAIATQIGITGKYASFRDFFDNEGGYKLSESVNSVYTKKPGQRGTYDKELIRVDERMNVYYLTLTSALIKIFPIENDANNKWVSPREYTQLLGGNQQDNLFTNYMSALSLAITSGDYREADKALEAISENQQLLGQSVIPSPTKVKLEILYNEWNIFKRLFPVYLLIGSILVGLFFIQLYKPKLNFSLVTKILVGGLLIAFLFHTFGLGLRWYISGHAPWSNGYESMIYIAWAAMLAGFFLMRQTPITIGITAMLAGITLLTAHMSWLDPEITNLVPVLKSYWLTFHVATITASYGFLGLACMIGLLNLILMIARNNQNGQRIDLALRELTLINELSMDVGLVLLIIGNFLGGIWANESWGRYWGWDPKETWTLVTIILYVFTLHTTLIPAIRTRFSFNLMSVISFGAVLMTYFGVNYYLSGLHSYAAGDPVPIPSGVYYGILILLALAGFAGYKEYQLNSDE